jgi:hypothetical protein
VGRGPWRLSLPPPHSLAAHTIPVPSGVGAACRDSLEQQRADPSAQDGGGDSDEEMRERLIQQVTTMMTRPAAKAPPPPGARHAPAGRLV